MTTVTLDLLDQELGKRWFQRRSPLLNAAFEAQHSKVLRTELSSACQLEAIRTAGHLNIGEQQDDRPGVLIEQLDRFHPVFRRQCVKASVL